MEKWYISVMICPWNLNFSEYFCFKIENEGVISNNLIQFDVRMEVPFNN